MRGGKRIGAGRPVGTANKANIYHYWSREDIAEYFEYLKDAYKESDKLNQFVGEQLMGKAQQQLDVTSGGEKIALSFDNAFTRTSESDSN